MKSLLQEQVVAQYTQHAQKSPSDASLSFVEI
jgi:hypothetical protein